jgi:hypothetical protein
MTSIANISKGAGIAKAKRYESLEQFYSQVPMGAWFKELTNGCGCDNASSRVRKTTA